MAGRFNVYVGEGGQELGRSQMYKSSSGHRSGMKSVARNSAHVADVEE